MAGEDGAKTYKIGQAAKLLGVKPYVLRFWEGEFWQLEPKRTPSGQRYYTEDQIGTIERIKHLLWEKGLTIQGAKRELEGGDNLQALRRVADELLEIRDLLTRL